MEIRRAVQGEFQVLSDLAFRSKAYWNYGSDYMDAARNDLTVSPVEIEKNPSLYLNMTGKLLVSTNLWNIRHKIRNCFGYSSTRV
ncbi:hypothetical protein [Alicyclobacillus sp. SO9]|uniref:hypothetical protein n=1 Tax=Alicyclobacillus sp. SO9 TaxID=2665646 RepID=UPI001E4E39EE|nr:hypothetical protein [Alicyclobacillus sp. SO9]